MIPGITAGATAAAGGPTDPFFASTILLLSGDGANGSTVFTDESAAARGNASVSGPVAVSTAIKQFGTGAMLFSGGPPLGISYPDHSDWTLGSSDFTYEHFLYFNDISASRQLANHYISASRGWAFQWLTGGTLRLFGSSTGSGGSQIVSTSWTPTLSTWYYVCLERSGNTFRIYIGEPGGTASMVGSASSSISFFDSTQPFRFGVTGDGGGNFLGSLDELRFTLGVARYATDAGFAVPTEAFPRS